MSVDETLRSVSSFLLASYILERSHLLMHKLYRPRGESKAINLSWKGRSHLHSKLYLMAKTSTGGYCGAVSTLVRMGFVHCVLVLIVVFDLKNAWGSLRYNQSPRSMKPQSDPVSRGTLSSRGFWNPLQKASPLQSHDSRGFAQESLGLQEKQVLQGPVKPLDWSFPSFQRCSARWRRTSSWGNRWLPVV